MCVLHYIESLQISCFLVSFNCNLQVSLRSNTENVTDDLTGQSRCWEHANPLVPNAHRRLPHSHSLILYKITLRCRILWTLAFLCITPSLWSTRMYSPLRCKSASQSTCSRSSCYRGARCALSMVLHCSTLVCIVHSLIVTFVDIRRVVSYIRVYCISYYPGFIY